MGGRLSVIASCIVVQEKLIEDVPELWSCISRYIRSFSPEITMTINQFSYEDSNNSLFQAAVTYIDGHVFPQSGFPQQLTVDKLEKVRELRFGLEDYSEIVDTFQGEPMKWKYRIETNPDTKSKSRWYELRFQKKHADMVKEKYLPHVLDKAKEIEDKKHVVSFHTVKDGWKWKSNKGCLTHPMTFDKLCLDGDLKETLLEDLKSFTESKEYYNEIGKVWKRGYLLYGPPGTGKSSLIAAMANYLNYDIYYLNLSEVHSDSSLEHLLLRLPSRTILVVEDIDCSIKLQNRESNNESADDTKEQYTLTLAALLNVLDGLLSCYGDERITVFTTNYKDQLDPALLRPGRMDKHVELSYCTFSTFKQLAAKYLKNDISVDDKFSREIEMLFEKVKISPAEVAGELMRVKNSETPLQDFIKFLKKKESEEKSSDALSSTSKVDKKRPKEENDNNLNQQNRSQAKYCPLRKLIWETIMTLRTIMRSRIQTQPVLEASYP